MFVNVNEICIDPDSSLVDLVIYHIQCLKKKGCIILIYSPFLPIRWLFVIEFLDALYALLGWGYPIT